MLLISKLSRYIIFAARRLLIKTITKMSWMKCGNVEAAALIADQPQLQIEIEANLPKREQYSEMRLFAS